MKLRAPAPLALGAALVVARAPYLLARSVEDDAFITWRCAVELADTGVYGFNPGERVSASSSHAFVALVAVLRLVFGGAFIPATLVVGSVLAVASAFLVADALVPGGRGRDAVWALLAMVPAALVLSTSGMETALLVFTVAVALHAHARDGGSPARADVAVAALPLIRLDAALFAVALAVAHGAVAGPRRALRPLAAAGAGLAGVLAFNAVYFGVLLNQSVVAKLSGVRVSHAAADVAARVAGAYVGLAGTPSVYAPLATRYAAPLGSVVAVAALAACVTLVRRAAPGSRARATAVAVAVVALVPPALYAGVAVLYGWYVWPSVFFASAALIVVAVEAGPRARVVAGVVVALLALGQGVVAYAAGMKTHAYVLGVAARVRDARRPGDTLFSETAGLIPFVTGLPTDDTWGLVSPRVLAYQRTRGAGWEAAFLREHAPTWIVLRTPLEAQLPRGVVDGDREAVLAQYPLVAHVAYSADAVAAPGGVAHAIAGLGTAPDYFVYRIADDVTTTPGRPRPR